METGEKKIMETRIGPFRAYGLLFYNAFRFRGTATRREYWFAVLMQGIVASLCVCFGSMAVLMQEIFTKSAARIVAVPAMVLAVVFTLGMLAFISLTVRRLRDAGKSAWWTWLVLAAGFGTVALMLLCAGRTGSSSASNFDPSYNEPTVVYGPPSWFEDEFDPSRNVPDEVYGPPDWDVEE